MAVSKRASASAAAASAKAAATPIHRSKVNSTVVHSTDEGDRNSSASTRSPQRQHEYRHQNPLVLLGLFALASCVVVYCAYHFYWLQQNIQTAKQLARQLQTLQESHARQEELNSHTSLKWNLYAEHRGNVTQILLQLAQRSSATHPSLCILGAGNLNDVSLGALLRLTINDGDSPNSLLPRGYSSLALVDLDPTAMERGWKRQVRERGLDDALIQQVKMYISELTGSFETMDAWKKGMLHHKSLGGKISEYPPQSELDAWVRSLQAHPLPADGKVFHRVKGLPTIDSSSGQPIRYNVVASICILSQLLDMYMTAVPEVHPGFLAPALAMREAHIAQLIDLLKPGGWGLLVTDVVASSSCPELRDAPHASLPTLLTSLLERSNFFTGCNPHAIRSKLLPGGPFANVIEEGSVNAMQFAPWKWRMGGEADKQFLVVAIAFQKKPKT